MKVEDHKPKSHLLASDRGTLVVMCGFMVNASQVQEHFEESLWLVHVGGPWTHIVDNKNKHCEN